MFVIPGATLRLVVNRSAGNSNPTIGVIVHVTTDDGGSAFNYFNRPHGDSSSTWFVGNGKGGAADGEIEQYVDPDNDHSWAQESGNWTYHSIEFEGTPSEPMTDLQLRAGGHILAQGHVRWGWPIQLATVPGDPGLGYHAMGGRAWGGHSCPQNPDGSGPRLGQLPQILAYALQEIHGTPTPEEPDMTPAESASLAAIQAAVANIQFTSNAAYANAGQALAELRAFVAYSQAEDAKIEADVAPHVAP